MKRPLLFFGRICLLAIVAITFFALFFSLSKPILAVTVSITSPSPPITITNDSFTLTASISGAATGTNYLRVDVYKEGTTNYFGETFNNSDWYSGSDGKQYLPISVQSGVILNGTVQARIGSPTATEYDGSGSYRVRIKRYTSSGSAGSEDANNSSVAVVISIPTSTPSPTPTPTNAPTSTPTKTPTPTPSPTPSPIPSLTITSAIATSSPTAIASVSGILGENTKEAKLAISLSPSKSSNETKVLGATQTVWPVVLLVIGIILVVFACGILEKKKKKQHYGE